MPKGDVRNTQRLEVVCEKVAVTGAAMRESGSDRGSTARGQCLRLPRIPSKTSLEIDEGAVQGTKARTPPPALIRIRIGNLKQQ